MRFRYILFILITVAFITCDTDKGLDIIPWIEGKIIIDSIKRVEEGSTGDMVVVVAPDFPPQKWTDIIKTPPLHFERNVNKDTTEFKVPLNSGTYAVVAVLWKPKGKEWSFETISNILGVYTEPNIFEPKPVAISKEDKFVPDIDIYADFGFVRYGAYIEGKITYEGEFNPDTDMIVLASFPMKPETVVDYLFALGWDLTLPIQESAYHPYEFNLSVAPAYHKYIAVFWKGKKGAPYDFKKLASIMLPDDLPQIGSFVPEGKWLGKGQTLEWFVNDQGDTINVELELNFNKTYE